MRKKRFSFFFQNGKNIHTFNIPNLPEASPYSYTLLNMKTVETLSCLTSNRAIAGPEVKFEDQIAKTLFH